MFNSRRKHRSKGREHFKMKSTFESENLKRRVFREIDNRKKEIIRLCSDMIKAPSENPPGDTLAVASIVKDHLSEIGLDSKLYEPKKGLFNLVSTNRKGSGPSLVYNAHMDVFPAGDREKWAFDPFSGRISSKRVYGRGAVDMKGGLVASLAAYSVMGSLDIELPGTLAIAFACDEEVAGPWGTRWILENVKHLAWDACIIGEPSGTDCVVYGEKGVNFVSIQVESSGSAHSSAPFVESALLNAATIVRRGEELQEQKCLIPRNLRSLIKFQKKSFAKQYGAKVAESIDHVSLNVGTIKGGIAPNMICPYCEMKACFRVPFSISPEKVVQTWIRKTKSDSRSLRTKFTLDARFEATYTNPKESVVLCATQNALKILGRAPRLTFSLWGTDGRYMRKKGIPTVIYGPSPDTMATFNEFIDVEELLQVAKVHAGAAFDYLWKSKRL